jgi:hypothetical protein
VPAGGEINLWVNMISVKILAHERYKVVAIAQGGEDHFPAERFLHYGEASQQAHRLALIQLLERVSKDGLDQLPSSLCHLVDQSNGIYEFVKGPLRLFFFKGANGDIAVCTGGGVKKSQKVDARAVSKAISMKQRYIASNGQVNYIEE